MAAATAASLRYEVEDAIATITLDRPDARNALDAALKRDLLAALERRGRGPCRAGRDPDWRRRRVLAGQDLRETTGDDAPPLSTVLRESYNPLILALRRLDKPVIGSVNGVAAGAGMALALACDLRIAADTATFVLAFGRVGLVPDSGTTWFLPRVVGQARAAELALVGDPLTADAAERWGLVTRVVPAAELAAETNALALRLAAAAPQALALTKEALNRSPEAGLEEQLEREAALQGIAGRTADHREGVAAFLDKRPPRFTGE